MNVVVKKVGRGEYAYLVVREGRKVVHKYLGSVDNPRVARILRDKKEASAVPIQFRSLFWDTSLPICSSFQISSVSAGKATII